MALFRTSLRRAGRMVLLVLLALPLAAQAGGRRPFALLGPGHLKSSSNCQTNIVSNPRFLLMNRLLLDYS